jgi:hypothetical protein
VDAMMAAIRSWCKTPDYRRDPQIFDEKAKADGNTVNGCLAPGSAGDTESSGKPADYASRTIRLMAKPPRQGARRLASFRPCVTRAVDGIFRPGGGSLKTDFKSVFRRTCRLGKISHARRDSRGWLTGEI